MWIITFFFVRQNKVSFSIIYICCGAYCLPSFTLVLFFDRSHDFSIGVFDERTVILCDQVLS